MSAPSPDQPIQPTQPVETQSIPPQPSNGGIFFVGFVLFWVLAGIAALIMSLVCFGMSGSTMEKIVGLSIAFFLGPLYFVFYGFNKGYCRNMGANVIRTVNTTVGGR